METKLGKVTHYYSKIGVAVIKVEKPIKKGDKIRISGHDNEFEQVVESMQQDYKEIKEAKAGESIGLKVDYPVKENDEIYKID